MQWEDDSVSVILKEGLQRIEWWRRCFQSVHPITHDRLVQLHGIVDVDWRALYLKDGSSTSAPTAVQIAAPPLIMQSDRELNGSGGSGGDGWPILDLQGLERVVGKALCGTPMRMARVWSLTLSKACVVVLQNSYTGHGEVLWLPQTLLLQREEDESTFNVSVWAINRNKHGNSLDMDSFVVPPALLGDASLPTAVDSASVLVASCYHVACAAVILRHRHVLIFDADGLPPKSKQGQGRHHRHWRQLVSMEMTLPSVIPVSAACFVLDEYLLLAHHDGVLRAHPRRNPRSTYHVEDLGSLVPHMTSRFNVVALIRDCWVLEVRRVFKRHDNQDPFIGFELLYSVSFADGDYAPLLYGRHVLFRGLDGTWHRVCYDDHVETKKKTTRTREAIALPSSYSAAHGWRIETIDHASLESMTMNLRNLRTGQSVAVVVVVTKTTL